MDPIRQGMVDRLLRRLNLRFPALFLLFSILFLVDFVVPDFVPFVDEIGLALLAAIFGLWRRRRGPESGVPPGVPR